jgi:NADP-dependent 3-hydroxy acid dehydrogenase YdfG
MLDTINRVVMISGANRGIGRAIAETLYARGYRLSLGARDPASLAQVTAGWDVGRFHNDRYVAADRASHESWVAATVARFGRIDVLVNNAGTSRRITIRDGDEESLDELWRVNRKAPLNMIRLALPHLEAAGTGRIINVASLSGKRVKNDNVGYAMSKFAVMALTHAARQIAWDKGVRATAICPSFVRTDMTAGSKKIAPEAMIDPSDLAEVVATVIALPNTAAIAEILVNCRLEDSL